MDKPMSMKTLRWLSWSLALPVATLLATAAIMSIPPNTQGIDIVAGQELFTTHCASCHFVKVGFPAHLGPNLHDIGKSGATRQPNQSAAEYILESIVEPAAFMAPSGRPGMPPDVAAQLDPEDIRKIVGFLASRGAFPDFDEIIKLEIPDRRTEPTEPTLIRFQDMKLAEQVLRDKGSCLKCHSLYSVPEGKSFAPGLFGVGLNDAKAIYESLINPDHEIKPQYQSVKVMLESGELVSGQLISQSDAELVICTRDDQNQLVLREIALAEIEKEDGLPQIRQSKISLMPTGFDKTLTREEIDALINLIRQLN